MGARTPIKISWEGVEYKIIVNMLLLERIDDEIGIIKIMGNNALNPKIFTTARFIHLLLDEAGLKIDLEQVYDGLGEDISNDDLKAVMKEITPMLLPQFNGIAKKKASPKKKRKPRKK